jgi:hypothetical protein
MLPFSRSRRFSAHEANRCEAAVPKQPAPGRAMTEGTRAMVRMSSAHRRRYCEKINRYRALSG